MKLMLNQSSPARNASVGRSAVWEETRKASLEHLGRLHEFVADTLRYMPNAQRPIVRALGRRFLSLAHCGTCRVCLVEFEPSLGIHFFPG